MRLKAGVPVPLIAANTDTGINISQRITLITERMNPQRSLVKVERSSQQRKASGGLDQVGLTIIK